MIVTRTIADVRAALADTRGRGLAPTMGALHAGHVALFEAARAECDVVVASAFVNPTQFGPGEDYKSYPRDPERDAQVAAEAGVDVLFIPSVEEMYPEGFSTWVHVGDLGERLEGAARPGHFRGVATVCLKLFNIIRPERAYFGLKDAQQLAVVERLVSDLALGIVICAVPTVRDQDDLALSSRNVNLSAAERAAARALPTALFAGREAYGRGEDAAGVARALLAQAHGLDPEYVEIARFNGRVHLVAAARAGRTRLIDNVLLEGDSE